MEGLLSRSGKPNLRTATLVLLLDLLLVPLNPNGLQMFTYPIETLRSAAMQNYIAEWGSPNFHDAGYWPLLLVVLATFVALAWSGFQVRVRDLLLSAVGLYAGLSSIRMMPLFILIAVPLVAQRLRNWHARFSQRSRPAHQVLANALIVVAMAAFAGFHIFQVIQRQPEAERQHFPAGAVAFLEAHPTPRIFNHYDWGGYLIWRLSPATPVFIDGRADLYGKPLLDQFADTYQFKGGWRQTLQSWNVERVLVPPDSALATGLRNSADWTVSYEDAQAIVLTASPRVVRSEATRLLPSVGKKIHLPEQFAGYYVW